jgi:uncharacterized protein (TIGR02246 family)
MTTHEGPRPDDEAAIRAVFDRLAESWNRGDGAAYGRLFTGDADYVDVTGAHHKGGEAIGRLHRFLFDGPLKGSTLEGGADGAAGTGVSFLAPDVAISVGGGASRLAGEAEEAPAERRSVNTTVLVKRDGEWRIRAFQNNRVQPPPQGFPARGGGSP